MILEELQNLKIGTKAQGPKAQGPRAQGPRAQFYPGEHSSYSDLRRTMNFLKRAQGQRAKGPRPMAQGPKAQGVRAGSHSGMYVRLH